MAGITLKDVRKTYGGGIDVIKGVSLDIADGELVVLVGPSGCGKSTLLRMIAGLESITSGTVSINDRVVNELEPSDRDIAMVFQNYALYPHMTVRQNLAYGLKNRNMPKDEIERRIAKTARSLEIEQFLERKPRQLSGGQRQRVAMGRAIVREPAAFLFDEPLSNLDAKLRVTMRVEIKELHQRLKTTTIYVTHDQIEAMTMADKIVVMRDGLVEQIGAPLDLYDHPANVFVAGFIGSPAMNFVRGKLATMNGETVFVSDKGAVLPVPASTTAHDEPVIYGIRPEHIEHGGEGLPATISVLEPTGSETQIFAHIGGDPINAVVKDRIALRPGETIPLLINRERVHLFERKSGRRV